MSTSVSKFIAESPTPAGSDWSWLHRTQETVKCYYQLTKPRIIVLLIVTTAGAMWLAGRGQVDPVLFVVTLLGGWLAASSANTINCILDQDIDYIMERTRSRPIPSGRVQPRQAFVFALVLASLSFTLLTVFANLLSALLAMSGILTYVFVYTLWLKRSTPNNIVIGGAAGAIPPLVGWAAVTGELSWAAWVLFGIILLWTPPHFWALALMIRKDYEKVGIPMLPVLVGEQPTANQILGYTLVMVPFTLLLCPLGAAGLFYGVAATLLGGVFVVKAVKLFRNAQEQQAARELFKFSIFYCMLLFAAMGVDSLPIVQTYSALALKTLGGLLA
ncbi:heme o synthase [Leptolyngbya sp. FACHB-261]|uniref:heme o synthase n=1 Tax=Leptolyngbya sp. FACHB-261 TaxID=2692806 RepID=UPI00168772A9|nr:heme o synthase [Leptolyngbya sp. FACHB-261]MBD2100114.1 protoheme IX farnesyltransferase [Leptolyngbya sp. FACHB-261]